MLQHGAPSRNFCNLTDPNTTQHAWPSQSLDAKACTSTTEAMTSTGHKFAMLSSSCASFFFLILMFYIVDVDSISTFRGSMMFHADPAFWVGVL